MKISKLTSLVSVCVVAALPACSNGNNLSDQLVTGSISQLPKGYDCPMNSNDLYPVGSVYRRDANGVFYNVKDLSKSAMITDHVRKDIKISDYEITDTQKMDAEASVALLKKVVPGLSVNANAKKKRSVSVDVNVKDIRADDIDDEVEGKVVAWLKQNVSIKPGNKYYLVRQAVKASEVSYKIKKQDLAQIGADADLENIAKTSANLSIRDSEGSINLSQTFEPRITVCTKSAEITSLMPK